MADGRTAYAVANLALLLLAELLLMSTVSAAGIALVLWKSTLLCLRRDRSVPQL